tara:strand:+ start:15019 stop:16323 length:1305 start_codon:yes stop_codon:yes gene_type:complete
MSAINVNSITGRTGTHGPVLTGVTTVTGGTLNTAALNVTGAASFSSNVSIAGTLTYDDVTSIDSVGIITAQAGIQVTSGSVGIGTAIPGALLSIESTAANAARIRLGFDSPRYYDIFRGSTTNSGYLNFYGSQSSFVGYVFDGVDGERMRIDTSGRLLLGTTTEGEATADNFTIADSGHCGITLRSGDDDVGTIFFSDGTSGDAEYEGYVQYDHSGNFMKFATNHAERLRVDSTGRLLVGTTSDVSPAGFNNRIQVNTNSYTASILLRRDSNNDGAGNVVFAKSRSSSLGGHTIVQSGDDLGKIYFYGADGTDTDTPAASIEAAVDGTPGTNDMPGRLMFKTTADGASSSTERLRITSEGHLLPGSNNTYDLGSVTNGWRNVYSNDLNLSNMNGDSNDIDGTNGSWTIQEGKDDLFLINRLTGKKYKFNLTEVS